MGSLVVDADTFAVKQHLPASDLRPRIKSGAGCFDPRGLALLHSHHDEELAAAGGGEPAGFGRKLYPGRGKEDAAKQRPVFPADGERVVIDSQRSARRWRRVVP